jgi:hypothetical protein
LSGGTLEIVARSWLSLVDKAGALGVQTMHTGS